MNQKHLMSIVAIMSILLISFTFMACGGGIATEPGQGTAEPSTQEKAEMVAAALSANQGGVGDDITTTARTASGADRQQSQARDASFGYSVSVTVDFYDQEGNLQEACDPHTTDRIDYQSLIQGQITNGTGFFTELSIDNRSDYTMDDIQSGIAWINGTHTNQSSYSRTELLTRAQVHFQMDGELILTDVSVDLDASDSFPESGTIEGSLSGSFEREAPTWQQSGQYNFHFLATFLGDNTAEVELGDGTTFIVQLDTGTVHDLE